MKDREELRESFIKGVMPHIRRRYDSDVLRRKALDKLCCFLDITVYNKEYSSAMKELQYTGKKGEYVLTVFDDIETLLEADRAFRLHAVNKKRYNISGKERHKKLWEKHRDNARDIIKRVFPNHCYISFNSENYPVFEYYGKTYRSLEYLIKEVLL